MNKEQPAPPDLGPDGKTLWDELTANVLFRSDELAILEQACRARDTVAILERALQDAPALVEGSKSQPIVNPVIQELRLTRQMVVNFLAKLDVPDPADPHSLTPSQRGRLAAKSRWNRDHREAG
jgi:hypothetical protein